MAPSECVAGPLPRRGRIMHALTRAASFLVVIAWGAAACVGRSADPEVDRIAVAYVGLVLAMAPHDSDYVDAYYGPPEWKVDAEEHPLPLARIRARADSLAERLRDAPPGDRLDRHRPRYLAEQLRALSARCAMLQGERFSFDEESRALFGAVAPAVDDSAVARIAARLDSLLPGRGPLAERYLAFRKGFVIPRERIPLVMDAALREARERTRRRIALPPSERFTIEYVTSKSWSAYNWYQGSYHSLIQVNLDLPIHIDAPIGLACHEGYPGHHVQNVLLESHLVHGRGWIEYTIYPLFSPESLLMEGAAEAGIDVAFPGGERLAFEKRALYPLAGLDTTRAGAYDEVRRLVKELRHAKRDAERKYVDGAVSAGQLAAWLRASALETLKEADQSVRFVNQYRSYVINYTVGENVVRERLASRGGTPDRPDRAWAALAALLSEPPIMSEDPPR